MSSNMLNSQHILAVFYFLNEQKGLALFVNFRTLVIGHLGQLLSTKYNILVTTHFLLCGQLISDL